MMKAFKQVAAGLGILAIAATNVAPAIAAEEFKFTETLRKGLKKTKDILEEIERAKKVIEDIQNNRSPTPRSGLWKDFVAEAGRAAEDLKNAPLPTRFDEAPYKTSFDEFAKCKTRPTALIKLNGQVKELGDAIERGESAEKEFSDIEDKITQADQSVVELRKAYEKLVKVTQAVEQLRQHFSWGLFDLNTSIPTALGKFRGAVQDKKKAVVADLKLVRKQRQALSEKIPGLTAMPCQPG